MQMGGRQQWGWGWGCGCTCTERRWIRLCVCGGEELQLDGRMRLQMLLQFILTLLFLFHTSTIFMPHWLHTHDFSCYFCYKSGLLYVLLLLFFFLLGFILIGIKQQLPYMIHEHIYIYNNIMLNCLDITTLIFQRQAL